MRFELMAFPVRHRVALPRRASKCLSGRTPAAEEMVGAPRFELGTSWSRTKRATRLRYAPLRTVAVG